MLPQFAKLFLRETAHISHDMSVHLLSNVKVETELFIVHTLNAFTITQVSRAPRFSAILLFKSKVTF